MILIPICLALFTWLLILWLCNQHKYLNIFEQIVLWFVSALSLFVFELFLQGVIFNHLSLLPPVITFIILLGIFLYKNSKKPWYIKEIITSIKTNFSDIWKQFISLKSRKKYLVIGMVIYALVKIIMVFSINLNMPTFDDDAVTGWDLKTKIFSENKSLILDKNSPEFLWSALERNIFAPLTDTYFLLSHTWNVNGLTNIISALSYLLIIFLLFGIFLRKSNLFFASLSWYIYTSLPFVFIHGIWSYRNFIWWFLIFVTIFYFIEQILNLYKEKNNRLLLLPITIIFFLASTVRNESVILVLISLVTIFIVHYCTKKNIISDIKSYIIALIWVIIWYIVTKSILVLYPTNASLVTWNPDPFAILPNLSANKGLFVAPFQQMFFHPDYILLYILFVISIILFFRNYDKTKKLLYFFVLIIILIGMSILILYSSLSMWLLTHFAYIRYSIFLIPFLIYFILMNIFLSSYEFHYHEKGNTST